MCIGPTVSHVFMVYYKLTRPNAHAKHFFFLASNVFMMLIIVYPISLLFLFILSLYTA